MEASLLNYFVKLHLMFTNELLNVMNAYLLLNGTTWVNYTHRVHVCLYTSARYLKLLQAAIMTVTQNKYTQGVCVWINKNGEISVIHTCIFRHDLHDCGLCFMHSIRWLHSENIELCSKCAIFGTHFNFQSLTSVCVCSKENQLQFRFSSHSAISEEMFCTNLPSSKSKAFRYLRSVNSFA